MTAFSKPAPDAVAGSLVRVLDAMGRTTPAAGQRMGDSPDSAAAPTPASARYRHDPRQPADLVAVLIEGTDRNGRRYFFAFDREHGRKLFMVEDRGRPGSWRLYSQPLSIPGPTLAPEPVERGPHGGRIVREPPLMVSGFVSALSERRKWER